jgi:hypothetical protein
MLPHEDPNSLKHYGVLGMHWGIRKDDSVSARLERKAAKLEKRAGYYDKRLVKLRKRPNNIQGKRALHAGLMALGKQRELQYGSRATKIEAGVDVAMAALLARDYISDFEFKAEDARRKAAKIRSALVKDINEIESVKTFESALTRAKRIMKDPFNQKKAVRLSKKALTTGYVLYKYRHAIDAAANLAIGLILRDRQHRQAAYEAKNRVKRLGDGTSPYANKMKEGVVYLINWDGTLTRSK